MNDPKTPLTLSTLLISFALSGYSSALEIRSYSASRHERFTGFPTTPVENSNSNFIAQGVDLTGVGWYAQETRRQYTLVSPKHFVGANHFRPAATGQLRFLDQDGTLRTYEIGTTHSILNDEGQATDLFLGTLEEIIPASDKISFQPYLSLATESNYQGQNILFMGHRLAAPKNLRIGSGTIGSFTDFGDDPITSGSSINSTRAFQIVYSNLGLGGDDAYAESGDSGSPSLVVVDGQGALVGTHTAVANATVNIGLASPGTIVTYDTFVPHYVEELNAIMEIEGYHMTRAVPGATKPTTTLTVTPTHPPILRAGYPFTLDLAVANTGLTEDANNLKLSATLPATAASGTLWVNSVTPGSLQARRGGLATGESSTLSLTMTVPTPGTFNSTLTLSADEFASASQPLALEIIESFRSFTSALTDQSHTGDDDQDQIPNLLEYAFDGDPATNSRFREGLPILPTITREGSSFTLQHLRRKDFLARGLTYELESSTTLLDGSWDAASPDSTETSSLDDDFEWVTATFPTSSSALFFRVQVTLNEE
ncbi:hypothetical protein V2O64_12925 [Verrucomicrobiaceae bacterium 227]